MSELSNQMKGLADEAVGKAKRALGELTARPDLVLEGEAQDAQGQAERAETPAPAPAKSGGHGATDETGRVGPT